MIKNKIIILAAVIVVLGVGFISYRSEMNSNKQTIKISDLSASTGAFAAAGEMLNNSAKIAAEEINAKGGINGRMVEIIVEDTENDSKKSVSAYQNSKMKGARYFIGEGSPIVSAVRPLALADGNLMMSSAAISASYTDDNVLSCRFSLVPSNVAEALVTLMQKNGYKNVSLLIPDSEYGRSLSDNLINASKARGLNFADSEFYVVGQNADYRTNITKIISSQNKTDALILMNNSSTLEPMIRQLKQLGWNKPIVSDNATMNNPTLKDLALVEGFEYVDYEYYKFAQTSDSKEAANFKEKYKTLTNTDPAYIPAGHYDAIMLIAYAIDKVGDDPKKVAEYISTLKDYKGITGTLTFNSDCEATRQNFYRKVENGKFVEVK